MNEDLTVLLRDSLNDPRFGSVVIQALQMIKDSYVTKQHCVEGAESSTVAGNIWRTRRSIGNYRKEAILGVDETIASLTERDMQVRLGSIETDRGVIAVWFTEEPDRVVGIITLTYLST